MATLVQSLFTQNYQVNIIKMPQTQYMDYVETTGKCLAVQSYTEDIHKIIKSEIYHNYNAPHAVK